MLIVDDNVDSADTLAQVVRRWGHEVAIANDGRSGLGLVTTFQPESALIDIGLTGMSDMGRRGVAPLADRSFHANDRHLVIIVRWTDRPTAGLSVGSKDRSV